MLSFYNQVRDIPVSLFWGNLWGSDCPSKTKKTRISRQIFDHLQGTGTTLAVSQSEKQAGDCSCPLFRFLCRDAFFQGVRFLFGVLLRVELRVRRLVSETIEEWNRSHLGFVVEVLFVGA